ncbi:MAG: LamG domain-containing protein [Polyangiaceae bacterium]
MRSTHWTLFAFAIVVPSALWACGTTGETGTIDTDGGAGDATSGSDASSNGNTDGASTSGDSGIGSRDAGDGEAGEDLEIDAGPKDPALRVAPRDGLVAHYRGDGENRLVDGKNAQIHSVSVETDRFGSGGAGKFVAASGSYVEIPGLTKLPSGAAKRTVSLWVKTSEASTAAAPGALATYGGAASGQRFGVVVADGKDRFVGNSPSSLPDTFDVTGSVSIADDRWHNVVVTYDGSTLTTWVDKAKSATKAIGLATSGDTLVLGKSPAGASPEEHFTGLVDDVRVYDRVVSPREIAELFHESGFPRAPTADLRAFYRADSVDRGPFVQIASPSNVRLTTDRFGRPNQAGAYTAAMQSFLEANNQALPVGNDPRTLSVWVKTNKPYTTDPRGGLAGWGTSAAGARFGLRVVGGNAAFVGASPDDAGVNDLFGTRAVADDVWHDVVVTYDGTTVVLWVDAVESARKTASLATVGKMLEVGRGAVDTSPQEYVDASLDDIRVYGRVLPPIEIGDLFHDLAY